jgi:hypothetical protein
VQMIVRFLAFRPWVQGMGVSLNQRPKDGCDDLTQRFSLKSPSHRPSIYQVYLEYMLFQSVVNLAHKSHTLKIACIWEKSGKG